MLSDHVKLTLKRGVKILTCDPQTRLIEAETRNGEVISVNAYHYTPMFRWPIPGEKWVVKEENGSWYLDGIYEPQGILPYPDFECPGSQYKEGEIVKFEGKLYIRKKAAPG